MCNQTGELNVGLRIQSPFLSVTEAKFSCLLSWLCKGHAYLTIMITSAVWRDTQSRRKEQRCWVLIHCLLLLETLVSALPKILVSKLHSIFTKYSSVLVKHFP